MSSPTIEPPPAPGRPSRRVPRALADPDRRSVEVGVTATILLHLLLFLIAPYLFRSGVVGVEAKPKAASSEFTIELEPEIQVPPPTEGAPPPMQFVEVNPNAPDNTPDNTNNFGAQNQQAAQETPTPDGKSDRPTLEGQTEVVSRQIVSGQLTQPQPPLPAGPAQPEPPTPPSAPAAAPRPEVNPLSGTENLMGDSAADIGSNVATISANTRAVRDRVEGDPAVAPDTEGVAPRPIDRNNPQPRQTVTRNVRPAIFQANPNGTANYGPLGVDAKWSNYGQYLQRLIDTVQARWDSLVANGKSYPVSGSRVVVSFLLDKEGRVPSITSADGTAGDAATNWCVTAISPGPDFSFGPWTQDMMALLGDRQELTFTFYYR